MRFHSPGLESATTELWWQIARACEYATFFHTPLWHQLVTKSYPGYQDASLQFTPDADRTLILPLLKVSKRPSPISVYLSSFAGCYGGFISDAHLEAEVLEAAWKAILGWRFGKIQLTGNPISPFNPGNHLFQNVARDFSHLLLLDRKYEALLSEFSKGHRSSIRRGLRLGVQVREAASLDDYRSYYQIYQDTLRRWADKATSRYPWGLFENGYKLSQKYPGQIRLWVAEVPGKMIAGAWVFYWNQHVVWWHGASLEAYFDYYPNNVLQAMIIQDAVERGYHYYDFNPSGGHEGVVRFKRSHGAQEYHVNRYTYGNFFYRQVDHWRA